jgi:hypothetical protein
MPVKAVIAIIVALMTVLAVTGRGRDDDHDAY